MASAGRLAHSAQHNSSKHRTWRRVLVLPDDARVDIAAPQTTHEPTRVAVEGKLVCAYRTLPRSVALVVSAIGTEFEESADHVPKYPLLEILSPATVEQHAPTSIDIPDLWALLNVLHTLFHAQETIPIILSPEIVNNAKLTTYLLNSGLARKRHTPIGDTIKSRDPELFLLRETFWQGGGTVGFHNRGWLRGHAAFLAGAPFPNVPSFTRTPLVITAHPLRPPKPAPGEVIYRRYFPSVGQTLEFTYFDLGGDGDDEVSPHLATFHRWHNSDHVNRGWGERGPIEKHRQYARKVVADPGVLPVMMSWDGELMGYTELVYIKENHVAAYIPGGAWDYDRGLHILVGEQKFRGIHRSKAWMCGIHHFLFLADPRTMRIMGEPKAANKAVVSLSEEVGMNVNYIFDFPYKRSVLSLLPRERWFKFDLLAYAEEETTPAAKL